MSNNKIHEWINTALIAVLIITGLVGFSNNQPNNVGGGTRYQHGISADSTSPSAGEVRGSTLTITGAQTLTGAATLSSTLGVAGVTSLTETLNVTEATGTSTVTVKATAASTGGRIILEDSDGAGCSELYVLDGTLTTATVTCP